MPRRRLLLMDACVLIDFARADVAVLTLAARHVGDVYVPTPVFQEVKDIDATMATTLGIQLFEPSLEMTMEAAATRGRVSFQDRLCLLAAKENGWTCVSNDKQLRATCTAEGVSIMWGFELLALLVEKRVLPPADAADLAKKIAAMNKRIGQTVLARFLSKIGVKG